MSHLEWLSISFREIFAKCLCLLLIFAPSGVIAEFTNEDCIRVQQLLGKTPAECTLIAAQTAALDLPQPPPPPANVAAGIPTGEIWQNHIFFPAGGSALDQRARSKLEMLGQILNGGVMKTSCLQLIGHSDVSGGALANERLGRQRAENVAKFLKGVLQDGTRIEDLRSDGETRPLTDRRPTDKWQRRVEIRARRCL